MIQFEKILDKIDENLVSSEKNHNSVSKSVNLYDRKIHLAALDSLLAFNELEKDQILHKKILDCVTLIRDKNCSPDTISQMVDKMRMLAYLKFTDHVEFTKEEGIFYFEYRKTMDLFGQIKLAINRGDFGKKIQGDLWKMDYSIFVILPRLVVFSAVFQPLNWQKEKNLPEFLRLESNMLSKEIENNIQYLLGATRPNLIEERRDLLNVQLPAWKAFLIKFRRTFAENPLSNLPKTILELFKKILCDENIPLAEEKMLAPYKNFLDLILEMASKLSLTSRTSFNTLMKLSIVNEKQLEHLPHPSPDSIKPSGKHKLTEIKINAIFQKWDQTFAMENSQGLASAQFLRLKMMKKLIEHPQFDTLDLYKFFRLLNSSYMDHESVVGKLLQHPKLVLLRSNQIKNTACSSLFYHNAMILKAMLEDFQLTKLNTKQVIKIVNIAMLTKNFFCLSKMLNLPQIQLMNKWQTFQLIKQNIPLRETRIIKMLLLLPAVSSFSKSTKEELVKIGIEYGYQNLLFNL